MNYFFTVLLSLCFQFSIFGAKITKGVPFITNYSDKDYQVSNNNWDIVQDQRGIMYFANEFGILEFDGNGWEIIQVASNRSNIRSLAFDKEGRLFAGAQGDFGYVDYWQPYGLHFISLIDKIPAQYRDFGDVFNIIIRGKEVIFQTWSAIFVYANDTIEVYKTPKKINGIFELNNKVLVQDGTAIYELTSDALQQIGGGEYFIDKEIRFMLPFKQDKILIGTHSNGLFVLKDSVAKPFYTKSEVDFKKCKITSGHVRKNGDFAIGTVGDGLYLFNKEGEWINHLTKESGLQNNEIRHLFSDKNGHLWVNNKKGIDFVELASPFSRIIPDPDEPLGVYSASLFNEKLFFATHNGLLEANLNDHLISTTLKFSKTSVTPDINWNLNKLGNVMIVAHAKGFSQLIGNKVYPLFNQDGGWMVKPIPGKPDYLLGGTYSGLILLKKIGDRYHFESKIDGFEESSRVIEIDQQGNIWVAHGYKGIYRLRLSKDLRSVDSKSFYNHDKGLPTNVYNSVFNIWGNIVFGTQYGFYKYDLLNDSIVIDKELSGLLGYEHGRKLQEDKNGNVWFIVGDRSGIIQKHANGTVSLQYNPFLKLNEYYIPGFENFYFIDDNSTLIGTKDGAILHDDDQSLLPPSSIQVLLRKVMRLSDAQYIYNDHYQYLCDTLIQDHYELPYVDNSLQFSFSSAFYENVKDVRYKFFLQGFDRDWSDWGTEDYKDYTNLKEGEYLFRVKAKNIHDSVSEEETFSFVILPPWYRSSLAYTLYAFVLMLTFILFLKVRNIKVLREKERYIKEQSKLRELEQAHFMEDKLHNELKSKNNELSGLAMQVIYKNEKLTELKERVSSIMEVASDKVAKKLAHLLAFIDSELDDDNWDDFELRFDQAHNNFIKKLKADFPDLTSKDLKICAYLRMNLSSKEIANLLNMTVRGVENARYRVRKRIHLDPNIHLTEWLLLRK